MIDTERYNRVLTASIIIVGSFVLSVVWENFIDSGIIYKWPFLDISKGHYPNSFPSLVPIKQKDIDFWELVPFIVPWLNIFLFHYVYRYVGDMKIGRIDCWNLQMILVFLLFLDWMLTHNHTPFRYSVIVASVFIQFSYCVHLKNQK